MTEIGQKGGEECAAQMHQQFASSEQRKNDVTSEWGMRTAVRILHCAPGAGTLLSVIFFMDEFRLGLILSVIF